MNILFVIVGLVILAYLAAIWWFRVRGLESDELVDLGWGIHAEKDVYEARMVLALALALIVLFYGLIL